MSTSIFLIDFDSCHVYNGIQIIKLHTDYPQAVRDIIDPVREKERERALEDMGGVSLRMLDPLPDDALGEDEPPQLPEDFKFKTEEEAKELCGRIRAAGGIAFVKVSVDIIDRTDEDKE